MNNVIDTERLKMLTNGYAVGHTIQYIDRVTSTMLVAKTFIEENGIKAKNISGTLFVTEEQTTGRGRRGRGWETPYATAVLASVIVTDPHLPQNPASLSMMAGLAAARAIDRFMMRPTEQVLFKWPNDLLLPLKNGSKSKHNAQLVPKGKVAGVLIESAIKSNLLQYAIIGIGINANQTKDELPSPPFGAPNPTSIRLFLEKAIDRTELIGYLCKELGALLTQPEADREIYSAWRSRLHTLNQHVAIYNQVPIVDCMDHAQKSTESRAEGVAPLFSGIAVDVTLAGDLVVEDDQGNQRHVSAGDVSVRQAQEYI